MIKGPCPTRYPRIAPLSVPMVTSFCCQSNGCWWILLPQGPWVCLGRVSLSQGATHRDISYRDDLRAQGTRELYGSQAQTWGNKGLCLGYTWNLISRFGLPICTGGYIRIIAYYIRYSYFIRGELWLQGVLPLMHLVWLSGEFIQDRFIYIYIRSSFCQLHSGCSPIMTHSLTYMECNRLFILICLSPALTNSFSAIYSRVSSEPCPFTLAATTLATREFWNNGI